MASSTIANSAYKMSLDDVLTLTNNFDEDNIIGHGGFGTAYIGRALLPDGSLLKVAARRLDRKRGEGDVEFWTEISVLSDLKHPNLVKLIGYCDEKDEKVIVTTYESTNGSLEMHLNNTNLTWTERLNICLDVALALKYLHYDEGRGYGVIHRNINSYTILLDENENPKLSGFEISIKQPLKQIDRVILCEPTGTIGYMDPAVEKTRGVTHKSDIYSFGVVLFEILCGRKAFIRNDANRFLAPLAKYHYENKTLEDIILPDLWNQMSPQSLVTYSKVAYSCLLEEPAHRPDMDRIIFRLKKAIDFQLRRENFEKNLKHLQFDLRAIKFITDNFSEACIVGGGRFSTLYKASIMYVNKENPSCVDGNDKSEIPVVIKRFIPTDDEEVENAFYAEIEALTSIKHQNIVKLLGSCVEGCEMILIVENSGYRNLASFLAKTNLMSTLTWEKRLKICIDIGHALNYLHTEMEDQKIIINRDINSYTIMLDENMRAIISEFGHSVFLPPNQVDEALYEGVAGQKSYRDPEFEKSGKLKRVSDVYSFGVVMFEMLCGKLADDPIYINGIDKGLACVARRSFRMGTINKMIDPTIKEETSEKHFTLNGGPNKDSLHTFTEIAYQCVAETQDQRPTMQVVVQELQKALFYTEDAIQHLDIAQAVSGFEKAMEIQLPREDISDELIQLSISEQGVGKLDKSLELGTEIPHLEHLKIPLRDIKLATDDFSNPYQIGFNDVYYTLYRAELEHFYTKNPPTAEGKYNGEHSKRHNTVIIKRLVPRDVEKGKMRFLQEINMLTRVKHRNIVTLFGFCVEASEMILVTEDVTNGYLVDYLNSVNGMHILSWETRLKICIDVAHALNYLHYEMEDQNMIINCDICSYNIGLGENWEAKIVEFGTSICLPQNLGDPVLNVNWSGRHSYIDPEFKMTSKLNRKSDVYSFGVVLFEILCGRLANHPIYKEESDKGLADVAMRRFLWGTLEELIDPLIKEETGNNNFVLTRGPNKDSLSTFCKIASYCVAETQDERPTMQLVVEELEKALFFQKNNKDNPILSFKDISQATRNFHNDNCIGGGGFGRVFKGTFQGGEGVTTIVAKRLDTRLGQGEQQFLSELQILLEYKHPNVIGLVGYCDEKDEKIIVYEYAPKGSLDRYLNDPSLTWVKRLNICIDVASALDFLHGGVEKRAKVIHRDIKTANILLNYDWKAKLADFGLSLISSLIQETDYVIDHACGTVGYVDPLYKKSGFLTVESDIYSFGVVLFEILCGRSTFAIRKHKGHYLPEFIKNHFEEAKHDEVVVEQIREQIVAKSLTTFQDIAYQCLHQEREKRPTTKRLLTQLKKALEFQNMASTMNKLAPLQIPLEDIIKATNNFSDDNIIRHDEFGTSYKGRLLQGGRLMWIAARRLDSKHGDRDLEFFTQISVLSDLKHTNLVSIIGFCDEKDQKIIITTYEANESLGKYLNNLNLIWDLNLTWGQILRVSLGVVRALRYLHYDNGRDYAIIHCNINSDTILLDDNLEAKLSGFEISIKQLACYKDQACLCEHNGTMGYLDPAIENTGGVTYKSDIYSFGVVLFEILCGRKAFIQNENEANRFLTQLVNYHQKNKTMGDIIDFCRYWPFYMSPHSFLKYYRVALSCLVEDPTLRSSTDYIVVELERAMELQLQLENIEKKLEHLKISLSDIKLATNNFSETYKIHESVTQYTWYRGEVDRFDKEKYLIIERKTKGEPSKRHNTVLIKSLIDEEDEQGEQAFYTEIDMLTNVKHQNIATLVGFCVEGSEMILVIENGSNGHLSEYFENDNDKRRILTWEKRLKICIEVAQLLNYLHYEMEDQKMIIHGDICSYNIGLDENWGVKILNFEYALFVSLNQENEDPKVKWGGRPNYIDPEYRISGKLNRKSDVYNFGVVLYEILCGKLACDPVYNTESDSGLVPVARRSFCSGTLEEMIDPLIKEETGENNFLLNRGRNKDSLHKFIEIANQCVAETKDQRPTMKVVLMELKKALFFQRRKMSRAVKVVDEDAQVKVTVDEVEEVAEDGGVFDPMKIEVSEVQIDRYKSYIRCYNCQEYDHYAAERLNREQKKEEVNLTREDVDKEPVLWYMEIQEVIKVQPQQGQDRKSTRFKKKEFMDEWIKAKVSGV